MKFGVIIFPGSNCDHDMLHVLGTVLGQDVQEIWHKETALPEGFGKGDCIIFPGGFSYGDYLRCGAIAAQSPVVKAVKAFAAEGGYVFGVCNGFQILCETGLLPGVLLLNDHQKFSCKNVYLKTATSNTALTRNLSKGDVLQIPIAHAEGRYYADEATLAELNANDQILFHYCSAEGVVAPEFNPNGALQHIAGICNKERNVFGMMPHPERASEGILGNADGLALFESLLNLKMA